MTLRRVLQVIPSVSPLRGGPSVMVRELAEGLARAGVESHVATTNDDGPDRLNVPCGVPVCNRQVTYWHLPRQARTYTFSWPLSSWLASHVGTFDVVHLHGLFSWSSLPGAYWSRRRRIPYVVRPLGTLNRWGVENRRAALKKWSIRFVEGPILGHAAAVHFTSEQERVEASRLPLPPIRSAVIPNPVTPVDTSAAQGAFSREYPHAAGRPIVLFMSRLDRKKGLDLLLAAFRQVRTIRPDAILVVAGQGDAQFESWLRTEATALDITDHIVFTGFAADTRKQALFAAADLFVLPSYSENFGIAAAEAMSAGVPVILSDQVALHTDVVEAGAGVVVPCDPEALAASMTSLLNDEAGRRRMGRRGAAWARERYSPDAVAGRVLQMYREALEGTCAS